MLGNLQLDESFLHSSQYAEVAAPWTPVGIDFTF
jgi:hypothetical protein